MREHLEKFNTENILSEIDKLSNYKAKIKYLIEIKTQYKHLSLDDLLALNSGIPFYNFVKWYDDEIDKLMELEKVDQLNFEIPVPYSENIQNNPNLKTQTANYLLLYRLGIIDFLKDSYPDQCSNDTDLAKILCQIMRYENEKELSSMRSLIKNHRNNSKKVETDKAMNEVKQIMTHHKLI